MLKREELKEIAYSLLDKIRTYQNPNYSASKGLPLQQMLSFIGPSGVTLSYNRNGILEIRSDYGVGVKEDFCVSIPEGYMRYYSSSMWLLERFEKEAKINGLEGLDSAVSKCKLAPKGFMLEFSQPTIKEDVNLLTEFASRYFVQNQKNQYSQTQDYSAN